MATEYIFNPIQLVQNRQAVLFNNSIPCNKGYVFHRDQSGVFTLRGCTPNCFARYKVTFNGNIAVPAGGTVGPIAIAITVNGEPVVGSTAIVTPAAVDEYFNVTSTVIVTVPKGCCDTVSVENVTVGATPATPGGAINVQNANIVIERIA